MFERYTEKARRVVFFARYEANQYRSPNIETEHLLLGLMREDKRTANRLLDRSTAEEIRQQIENRGGTREEISIAVDLPLANESKRVLAYAAEEAERLGHRHIGTEHLLLGLLREKNCFAAEILREHGFEIEQLREELGQPAPPVTPFLRPRRPDAPQAPIEIHGTWWDADYLREALERCVEYPWHWHKQEWKPRDIVIHRENARMSFDLSLANPPSNFELVKDGWHKDYCLICRWDLLVSSDPEHSTGYTNGRDWLCCECYEKFLARPDFFKPSDPEIT
jgi:hypothetical protein